jgi:putative oxidoreductase
LNTHSVTSGRLSIANRIAPLLLRLALSVTLLSAVADRFGIWGPPGAATVAWGDWTHFVAYTAKVNSFLSSPLAPALAIVATAAEALLGITLILGIFRRTVAFASAALFALFAVAMTVSFGVKVPLNFSVFVDFAAAFLLGTWPSSPKLKSDDAQQ